jgi:hypothetical protein
VRRALRWGLGSAIAFASIAHADGVGVIAVGDDRARIATAMAQAISAPRVVDDAIGQARAAIGAGAVPIATMQRFRRVRDAIDAGYKAYLHVDLEAAAQKLAAARTDAEPLVAFPGGAELCAEAALKLGIVDAHPKLARMAEARAQVALAIALDPDRPITLAEFSPDVVELVDSVRAQPAPAERVKIAVEPRGAMVTVDGKDVGFAPVEISLPRGQHVAVARSSRYHAQAVGFAVGAPRDLQLALEPDDDAAKLVVGASIGMAASAARELIDAAMRFADLDEIVVVAEVTRGSASRLRVQRCGGVPVKCTAVVEVAGDRAGLATAVRSAWRSLEGGDLREAPIAFERGDSGGQPFCKLCRNPYVIGGVALAAVATTLVVVFATQGSRPPPTVGVDPTQFGH